MKKCKYCQKEFPLSFFSKNKLTVDGHISKCKNCEREYSKNKYLIRKQDPDFVEKERKRGREKYRKLYAGRGKANIKGNERYRQKYPEKELARNKSANMKKPFEGAEKHHWSYNLKDAKDVIWLSKKQHMKAHRFIIYDQERRMYRRCDNNVLLDTKESHEEYIMFCIENKEN